MKPTKQCWTVTVLILLFGFLIFLLAKQIPHIASYKGNSACTNIPRQAEALRDAAERGCVEVVGEIVQQQRKTPVTNDEARLLTASLTGDTPTVQTYLQNGNDRPLLTDSFILACKEGHLDIVKAFIEAGVNVNAKDGAALLAAGTQGHGTIVEELLRAGANANVREGTALVLAASSGYTDIVRDLLANGAKANSQDGGALILASAEGHTEIVEMLLKAGADVNADNGFALLLASGEGHLDVVKILLRAGADIHKTPSHLKGFTPWAMATGKNRPEIVAELERAGAKGTALQRGRALFIAAMEDNQTVAEQLLREKADTSLQNEKGQTALEVAREKGSKKVEKLLENKQ